MTQLSKERLEEIRDYDTCVTLEESAEMARRLLASEAQEPVAEVKSWWPLGVDGGEQRMFNPIGNVLPIGTKLYAAPPVAQPVQVPDGWKLVPVAPTETMLAAAGDSVILNIDEALSAYKAMLSASPQPESE